MIKSILIALDDSETSKAALHVGIDMARYTSASLKGLYIEDVTRLLEWQPVELMSAAITTSSVPHGRPTEEQIEIEKQFVKEGGRLEELFKNEIERNKIKGTFGCEKFSRICHSHENGNPDR